MDDKAHIIVNVLLFPAFSFGGFRGNPEMGRDRFEFGRFVIRLSFQ
jgi:hypothetical protein